MFCARSGCTDNVHPMECLSTIQCFECPSHGMSSIIYCSDLVIHVVADELSPAAWTAADQLLDRVQQIV